MNNFTTTVLATARKQYGCILCTDPIWGGERCSKVVGRFEGRFFSVRYHINCISQSIARQIMLTEILPNLQKQTGNVMVDVITKNCAEILNTLKNRECSTCFHDTKGRARCLYCDAKYEMWEPKSEPSKQEIEAALEWGHGFLSNLCSVCPMLSRCACRVDHACWCGAARRLHTAEWVEAYRGRKT